MEQSTKKKGLVAGIILLVVGIIIFVMGTGLMVLANVGENLETQEPIHVHMAEEKDVYSYADVQYMTESYAYYAANDSLQFYMIFDEEWVPTIICMQTRKQSDFQDYIDWLYSDVYEGGPESMRITGYSQKMDSELIQLTIETFEEHFGTDYVDETNFEDVFGSYYVHLGQKNSAYPLFARGSLFLIIGVVCLVVGGVLIAIRRGQNEALQKDHPSMLEDGTFISSNVTSQTEGAALVQGTAREGSRALGILGAILGALLGGLLWAFLGALGYISGWIGILILWLSVKGYQLFSGNQDSFGTVFGVIFGLLMIMPATYVSQAWEYYRLLNETLAGGTTFLDAMIQLPAFLTSSDAWGTIGANLLMGYLFAGVSAIYFFASSRKAKKATKTENEK